MKSALVQQPFVGLYDLLVHDVPPSVSVQIVVEVEAFHRNSCWSTSLQVFKVLSKRTSLGKRLFPVNILLKRCAVWLVLELN